VYQSTKLWSGVVKFTVPLLVPQVSQHLLDNVFLNETLTTERKLHELFLYAGGIGFFIRRYLACQWDCVHPVKCHQREFLSTAAG